MKTICTQRNLIKSFILSFLFVSTLVVQAQQPDYSFKNPTLESGSANQVGSVYRFPNVRSGLDALVSIDAATGGAKVTNIDRTIDGFQEAFQPQLSIPLLSTGYVDFTITFVQHNTSNAVMQPKIDVTALDIDGQVSGALKLFEFDRLDLGGGIADFNLFGGQLTVSQVGTAFTGKNFTGTLFGSSVDTAALDVMFTVMSTNVSSFTFRKGADNLISTNSTRYGSLYFKRFVYPNSILSKSALTSFTGVAKNKQVNLSWSLTANKLNEVIVEKSDNATSFTVAGKVTATEKTSNYTFTDNNNSSGNVYYRLKMVASNGSTEYSNVLVFRPDAGNRETFKIYPSVINDNATVAVAAKQQGQGMLQVTDLGGRVVYQRNISLQAGSNNVYLSDLGNLQQGTYVAAIKLGNDLYNQKIMIQ